MNIESKIKYILSGVMLGFCFAVAGYAQSVPMVGSRSVPVDDPGAVEAAEAAVQIQGEKQNVAIELVRILKANEIAVRDPSYILCIEAKVTNQDEESGTKQFYVQIYKEEGEFVLKSWRQQKCANN